jgi:hypothetical protein
LVLLLHLLNLLGGLLLAEGALELFLEFWFDHGGLGVAQKDRGYLVFNTTHFLVSRRLLLLLLGALEVLKGERLRLGADGHCG